MEDRGAIALATSLTGIYIIHAYLDELEHAPGSRHSELEYGFLDGRRAKARAGRQSKKEVRTPGRAE